MHVDVHVNDHVFGELMRKAHLRKQALLLVLAIRWSLFLVGEVSFRTWIYDLWKVVCMLESFWVWASGMKLWHCHGAGVGLLGIGVGSVSAQQAVMQLCPKDLQLQSSFAFCGKHVQKLSIAFWMPGVWDSQQGMLGWFIGRGAYPNDFQKIFSLAQTSVHIKTIPWQFLNWNRIQFTGWVICCEWFVHLYSSIF